eukprot:scaffold242705_cov39-Tisochrysis_lutea.AAC.1
MGGGGHANNPTFTFQADWNKNKWKGYLFGFGIWTLGCLIPVKLVSFAQKKAGVECPTSGAHHRCAYKACAALLVPSGPSVSHDTSMSGPKKDQKLGHIPEPR